MLGFRNLQPPPISLYLLCAHEQHYASCISGMCVVDDIFVRSLIAIPDKEIIYYFAAWCAGIQIRVRGYIPCARSHGAADNAVPGAGQHLQQRHHQLAQGRDTHCY